MAITEQELEQAGWKYDGTTIRGRAYDKDPFFTYYPDANIIDQHGTEQDITEEDFRKNFLNQ